MSTHSSVLRHCLYEDLSTNPAFFPVSNHPQDRGLCPSQAIPLWTQSWCLEPLGASAALPHPCILTSLQSLVWPLRVPLLPIGGVLSSHHGPQLPLSPTISPHPLHLSSRFLTQRGVYNRISNPSFILLWRQWSIWWSGPCYGVLKKNLTVCLFLGLHSFIVRLLTFNSAWAFFFFFFF